MKIEVGAQERAYLIVDGRPVRYLGAGVHRVYTWSPLKDVRVEKVSTVNLLAELDAERLALVPAEDLQVVTLARHERAVVYRKGRAVKWLSSGVHQIWTVERSVDRATKAVTPLISIEVIDTSAVSAPLLMADVVSVVTGKDYVEATAAEGSVVVRYVDGQLDAVLSAGRHAAWNTTRSVTLSVIDLRERLTHVSGQEVMTKDRVSLRLNVSASFKVVDAKKLATVARAPDDVLYLALQLAARDAVTSRTLDELLAARDALAKAMTEVVAPRRSPGPRADRAGREGPDSPG